MYTIAITTFSKRFDLLKNLLTQIRKHDQNNKILICINGEKDGVFNQEYRAKILSLLVEYPNTYPIFFTEIRGLSKMWNTLICHSDNENIVMLNDDIEILTNEIFEKINDIFKNIEFKTLGLINHSFSHFLIKKSFIDKLGYFDERLIGFGEEDGDIIYRIIEANEKIFSININGIINIVSDIRHDDVEKGSINGIQHKYSNFNRNFAMTKKYSKDENSKIQGMFDYPVKKILCDEKQYPYEHFFNENKSKLFLS